ncbi:MAG TPA: hypothetical protein VLH56_04350 [Dissulfurispiraceae bacterium]|nr:hypothetical protein [Dissulfurispiraceae bacterium]
MEILLFAFIIGLIPAYIASKKGRSFGLWWIYGVLLFIIALPHAIMIHQRQSAIEQRRINEEGLKKCPHCAELIKYEAKICRYCSRDIAAEPPPMPRTHRI